jgi:hypothetical protein
VHRAHQLCYLTKCVNWLPKSYQKSKGCSFTTALINKIVCWHYNYSRTQDIQAKINTNELSILFCFPMKRVNFNSHSDCLWAGWATIRTCHSLFTYVQFGSYLPVFGLSTCAWSFLIILILHRWIEISHEWEMSYWIDDIHGLMLVVDFSKYIHNAWENTRRPMYQITCDYPNF